MNGLLDVPSSAYSVGVSAARHIGEANRFGDLALSSPRGSDARAFAEQRRDAEIDAALADEERALSMAASGPHDQAALAVAGFSVLSRLTEHDTFEGDCSAGRQAAALCRALATLASLSSDAILAPLCSPGTRARIDELARRGSEDRKIGALLLTA
jgi:hypothetical protein